MAAERGALECRVGINVQHPTVIMAHQTEAIVEHRVCDARGLNPRAHFIPANGIVVQHSGDLMEINARAAENIGDFRNRTCGAMCQPVTGHRGAVAHCVKLCVINRRRRREVQNDDWNFRALHNGQHSRGKRISCDVEKNQIHVRLAKFVAGFERLHRIVNEAEIHDLDAGTLKLFLDDANIAGEARFESLELRPVSIEADAEQSDTEIAFHLNPVVAAEVTRLKSISEFSQSLLTSAATFIFHPEIKIVFAYCTMSPVRMMPMACGTRFLSSMCGSNFTARPSRADRNFCCVALELIFKNSLAMNACVKLWLPRTAATSCNTVGKSSTTEMSTISIIGQNGKPRSAMTRALVCRTRASNDSICGLRMPWLIMRGNLAMQQRHAKLQKFLHVSIRLCLGINPQHGFRAGAAQHQPGRIFRDKFYAVAGIHLH